MIKIEVKREGVYRKYEVSSECQTLLDAFVEVQKQDPSFEFDSGCRSGVCGSCAVRVNGHEVLACGCEAKAEQSVAPLRFHEVIKDLRVKREYGKLQNIALLQPSHKKAAEADVQKIALQSDCILCGSCYSACPVLEVNSAFLGPFALTKVLRYADDIKEDAQKQHVDSVQQNGVWDCTLCGECALVCPQGINSKLDIQQLRNKSVQYGYSDPNFATMSFGNFGF
ncbi:MAG: succinate dehydrogenase/fumarate reductase iron-sulfur subunit [Campylobacterota bacterium]